MNIIILYTSVASTIQMSRHGMAAFSNAVSMSLLMFILRSGSMERQLHLSFPHNFPMGCVRGYRSFLPHRKALCQRLLIGTASGLL